MSTDAALVLGILIGLGVAGLVYLVVTGRLRFRVGSGGSADADFVIRSKRTVRRPVRDIEEAEELLADLPPEASEALNDALSEGRSAGRIVVNVNGKVRVYHSGEEVPPEIRAMMDRARGQGQTEIVIEVNGQRHTYSSRDEVPPEFRRFLPEDPAQ